MPVVQRRPHPLLLLAALVAVATIATGAYIRQTRGGLGTAGPPFIMGWDPQAALGWTILAVLVALAATVLLPRMPRLPDAAFLPAVTLGALALGVALASTRSGPGELDAIFDLSPGGSFEAKNEYLPGLAALSYGRDVFVDRFAELVPSLPVNVAGHPPAIMLLISYLGITSSGGLATLCIMAFALIPALTWTIARALGQPPEQARTAAVLAACSPVLLLFGVTSADALFAAVGAATAALLVARRPALWVAGCVALGVATLFSWALLGVGAWAAATVAVRDGPRRGLVLAACSGLGVLAVLGGLAAWKGYDPIGTLTATEAYYRNSVASRRPYLFWLFGSPVAWGTMLGVPIVAALLVGALRRSPAAVGIALVVLVAAVAGFTKAETERIWLPFVPLACAAAAPHVTPRRLRAIVAVLLAQALLVQTLTGTVW